MDRGDITRIRPELMLQKVGKERFFFFGFRGAHDVTSVEGEGVWKGKECGRGRSVKGEGTVYRGRGNRVWAGKEGAYQEVTTVENCAFSDTASLLHSLDSDFELVHIIQGVENAEDVNTILLGLLDEMFNSIVGQRRVGHTVCATEQHLERDVGDELAHFPETVPGVLSVS